jgi:predicted transcriptional regulator
MRQLKEKDWINERDGKNQEKADRLRYTPSRSGSIR